MKCPYCTYASDNPDPVQAGRNVAIHVKRAHPDVPSGNDLKRERQRAERQALALKIFEWSVVRQSDIGPGIRVCADALGMTTGKICAAIGAWDDPRGHMALVKIDTTRSATTAWRIEAYYNTSAPESTP